MYRRKLKSCYAEEIDKPSKNVTSEENKHVLIYLKFLKGELLIFIDNISVCTTPNQMLVNQNNLKQFSFQLQYISLKFNN